jgi:hypothetical protein
MGFLDLGGGVAMIYDNLVPFYLVTQKEPEARNSRVGTTSCGLQSLIVKIENRLSRIPRVFQGVSRKLWLSDYSIWQF